MTNPRPPQGPPTAQGVADLPEVLSPEQAAWLLQITMGRLEAATTRGELPVRAIGNVRKRRLYSKTALIELVRSGQRP